MKKIFTLMLAAGMLLGAASGARAIDFKASGEWLVGFGLGDGSLIKDVDNKKRHHEDTFNAGQRVRLQLDAVASETLSGTVFFEIGDQMWGQSESGGALGADSTSVVKLKNAYIDWMVPNTDLKLRMGLQAVALPNVAGGSAIMDRRRGRQLPVQRERGPHRPLDAPAQRQLHRHQCRWRSLR